MNFRQCQKLSAQTFISEKALDFLVQCITFIYFMLGYSSKILRYKGIWFGWTTTFQSQKQVEYIS